MNVVIELDNVLKKIARKLATDNSAHVALKDFSLKINRGDRLAVFSSNPIDSAAFIQIISGKSVPTSGKALLSGKVYNIVNECPLLEFEGSITHYIRYIASINNLDSVRTTELISQTLDFAELKDQQESPINQLELAKRNKLAMSIGLHIQADIVVIDKALDNLDDNFLSKAITRIEVCSKRDETTYVIRSGHNEILSKVGSKGVFINDGERAAFGSLKECISKVAEVSSGKKQKNLRQQRKTEFFELHTISTSQNGQDQIISVKLGSFSKIQDKKFFCDLTIESITGNKLVQLSSMKNNMEFSISELKDINISFKLENCTLADGTYFCNINIGGPGAIFPYFKFDQFPIQVNNNNGTDTSPPLISVNYSATQE